MSDHSQPNRPLDKRLLIVIFFTCFFDVVGFSIIIPLLPYLVRYYLIETPLSGWVEFLSNELLGSQSAENGVSIESIVIIGGGFAFLFAISQFISSSIWGKLSDRYGRSAILKWTILGTLLSHTLWMFSGSLELLLFSRIAAGLMAGNISVATAAIADITTKENRAAGMTAVGTAYGLGFITGPILGGAASTVDFLQWAPHLKAYGITPFSACALVAVVLSALNLLCFFVFFKETLRPENRDHAFKFSAELLTRSFRAIPISAVNRLGWVNLIFFFTFIGIEFNLSFLAFERHAFTKQQSALIYLLLGLSQTIGQWTVLKPMTQRWGERVVAVTGFIIALIGAVMLALVHTPMALYVGATIMSGGAGLVFPSLTGMVSQLSPTNQQGAMLGAFRSKGSIGHAFGPLAMSGFFWALGGTLGFFLMSIGFCGATYLVAKVKK